MTDSNYDSKRQLFFQRNWIAHRSKGPCRGSGEWPLYCDARITGEIRDELGPYAFFNTVPLQNRAGELRTPVILRISFHADIIPGSLTSSDDSHYHGGAYIDEIAALLSLFLGTRVWAGGACRWFEVDGDPRGKPQAWDERVVPPLCVSDPHRLVLPEIVRQHPLDHFLVVKSVENVSPDVFAIFVKACRSYQQAIWLAESQPHIAWLLLVSALETAAEGWKTDQDEAIKRLEASKPKLLEILREHSLPQQAIERIASELAPTLGATKKFVDFVMQFRPNPPDPRTSIGHWQVDWEDPPFKKTLSTIYGCRSKALHGGTPFPAPMCRPPFRHHGEAWFAETAMTGSAESCDGATWHTADAPINLHTFHDVARNVLINWWNSL